MSEENWKTIDKLYEPPPARGTPRDLDARGREIAAFLAAAGGD